MTRILRTFLFCLAATASCWTHAAAPTPSEANQTAPLYRTAHDAPLRATEKPMDADEGHTRLRVEFNGIEGDRVPGHLYLPKKLEGRRPAVLVQHGIGDKKQALYVVECCKMLAARGIIALAIDAPNRGERRKPDQRGPEMWNLSAVNQWYRQHCSDYSRALDYLAARPDVDAKWLGYVGFSWGAITGVTFAAHDERVRAMTSVVGGGLVGLLGPQLDPVKNVGLIAPRPLLFINATRDQVVLKPLATALHRAAGKGAVVKWYDTDHTFNNFDRAKIMAMLADFMKQSLTSAPPVRP